MTKLKPILIIAISVFFINLIAYFIISNRTLSRINNIDLQIKEFSQNSTLEDSQIDKLNHLISIYKVEEASDSADLFEEVHKSLIAHKLVLQNYQMVAQENEEKVLLTLAGSLENIIRFISHLKNQASPIISNNIEIVRSEKNFQCSLVLSWAYNKSLESSYVNNDGKTLSLAQIEEKIILWLKKDEDFENLRLLHSIYPYTYIKQQQTSELESTPKKNPLLPAPEWLKYIGKKKEEDNNESYYILDIRTNRIRQMIPNVALGNWILRKINGSWSIIIENVHYKMEIPIDE